MKKIIKFIANWLLYSALQSTILYLLYYLVCHMVAAVIDEPFRALHLTVMGTYKWFCPDFAIMLYTLMFMLFYSFAPLKKCRRTFIVPYLGYLIVIMLLPVFDQFRLECCLLPLYGYVFYRAKEFILNKINKGKARINEI